MSWENCMITWSEKRLNLLDPQPDQIDLWDVSMGLSHEVRFSGQIKEPYTVGEHSLRVAYLLKERGASPDIQLLGLLHDASEAYLRDMSSPVKALLPDYKALESTLSTVIYKALMPGMEKTFADEFNWTVWIKPADFAIFSWEARRFYSAESIKDWDLHPEHWTSGWFRGSSETEVLPASGVRFYFTQRYWDLWKEVGNA